jgi:uncharacterized membrane protein
MRGVIQFVKTTLVGGFFVVLPMVLLYILMGELFDAAIALGTPIADLLPEDAFGDKDTAQVVAVLLLLVVCFLTGLVLRTRTGNRILKWLENKVLEPIPGYTVLRDLSNRFAGDESKDFFQPAILSGSGGIKTPVLIVEEHAGGDYSVLIPIAPTPMLGTIQIARRNLVQKVDLPVTEALECFWHWGVGTEKLTRHVREQVEG